MGNLSRTLAVWGPHEAAIGLLHTQGIFGSLVSWGCCVSIVQVRDCLLAWSFGLFCYIVSL